MDVVVVVELLVAEPPVSVDMEVLVLVSVDEEAPVPAAGATTVVLLTFLFGGAPGAAVVSVFCSQAAKSAIAGRSQRYFFIGYLEAGLVVTLVIDSDRSRRVVALALGDSHVPPLPVFQIS